MSVTGLPSLLRAGQSGANASGGGTGWAPQPGVAKQRIDGLPKVLGEKIYARDCRARDLPGWPGEERLLYPLRCNQIDHKLVDYDLSMLPKELTPMKVIDYQTLLDDNMSLAGGMDKPFFARKGRAPDYYGQPVAILIFADYRVYRKAQKILQFNPDTIHYGERVTRPDIEYYQPEFEYVRDDAVAFNYVESAANYEQRYSQVAAAIQDRIKAESGTGNWRTFARDFKTQSMDPMFMEPESGLAWYDAGKKKLQLVLGTQSPSGDLSNAADIYGNPACRFQLDTEDGIELISCYPGGGFGGRDSSYFPMYLAMAAPYADGPLRWASTRFEQFQVGLKRHQSRFSETLAFDRGGQLQALDCAFVLNGGGRKNLSPYVAQLAALSSFCAYDIPKAVAAGKSIDSPDLIGGSQRGFGGPQAFLAIESLFDEAAAGMGIDPFALRRKNLIRRGKKTITGAPVEQALRFGEILDTLEQSELWQNRLNVQLKYQVQGLHYGVGLALSNQAYGTSGDGMYGAVQIEADGGIRVRSTYVDMGNGAATALGLAPSKWLGRNAANIEMGDAAFFNALGLSTSSDDAGKPNYVLKGSGSSSACLSAFYQYHAVEQAGLTLLLGAVLPAAFALWGASLDHSQVRWQDDKLTADGYRDIAWDEIVEAIYAADLPTVSAVHATYIGEFASAEFSFKAPLDGPLRLPLDYVALGRPDAPLSPLPRTQLNNPPPINSRYGRSTYAPCGALVAVSVDPASGRVQVLDCMTVVNAGTQLCPQLVSGQYQGGLAMAIGYVLLEDCPNDATGPGNGSWNLDKYTVARMADVPDNPPLVVLDPLPGEVTARGIAEAVMCPTPPAILNALSMATGGARFTTLPVSAAAVKEALS